MILQQIQSELKAPKSQRNNFGGYNYRSCEDILEALKPVLAKYKAAIILTDEMVEVGGRNSHVYSYKNNATTKRPIDLKGAVHLTKLKSRSWAVTPEAGRYGKI